MFVIMAELMEKFVNVIGGGLAGVEAAWQAAQAMPWGAASLGGMRVPTKRPAVASMKPQLV